MSFSISSNSAEFLNAVFDRYHKPEFIDPDPLSLVLAYPRAEDREIAALLSASLALGRVRGILSAGRSVLSLFGEGLREGLSEISLPELRRRLRFFRYRFFGAEEMTSFLWALRGAVKEYGSLECCFAEGYRESHGTVMPALEKFVASLRDRAPGPFGILLSDPGRGSAGKRLHLFLRWMVRRDAIDPGGWTTIPPAKLLVPLDTHIHFLSRTLGFTRRAQGDLRTALEVTESFGSLDPKDPVRFDFSLSRLGIHPEAKNSRKALPGVGNFPNFLS